MKSGSRTQEHGKRTSRGLCGQETVVCSSESTGKEERFLKIFVFTELVTVFFIPRIMTKKKTTTKKTSGCCELSLAHHHFHRTCSYYYNYLLKNKLSNSSPFLRRNPHSSLSLLLLVQGRERESERSKSHGRSSGRSAEQEGDFDEGVAPKEPDHH